MKRNIKDMVSKKTMLGKTNYYNKKNEMSLANTLKRGVHETSPQQSVIAVVEKLEPTIVTKPSNVEILQLKLTQKTCKLSNFRILLLISNYERIDMFKTLLSEIKTFKNCNIHIDYIVYDDRSSYTIDDPMFKINNEHRGKIGYWKTFNEMFKYCKTNQYDVYVFSPNDFINYDFNKIVEYGSKLRNDKYIFNIINDGRLTSWNDRLPISLTDKIRLQFFTDCGFFTNYITLESLDFTVEKTTNQRENIGSRVGSQLTKRINDMSIPIFSPISSFAYHGEHESLMNYDVRLNNKLLSKHD